MSWGSSWGSAWGTAWELHDDSSGVVTIPAQGGIISFTSAAVGRSIVNPPIIDQEGGYWRPSISNEGVVTLTDNASVAEGEQFAAFEDDDEALWLWQIDPCDQAEVTTLVIQSTTPRYISVKVSFTTTSDTVLPFRVYSVRPYCMPKHGEVPHRYEATVEARLSRPSVRIVHTGGPFSIDTINLRLKPLTHQVKG